ncbi:DUF3889 domain-containing protein [Mesobacillus subterraneus]|uniref:DUF3889 domain-containing protein n=1 Tax=Mesobacillus subterraneus TaxID=285983 RepID=A0A427TYM1_9BACI|nr:DUF3889 domain-containing protein [Mesobacillus subterraneus]RSD29215.1 DUF3889 domain-containing protein [Mesobacillus subterraneus]
MKKYVASILVLFILLMGVLSLDTNAQRPDYEKYGRIATGVIKEDYPGEEIRDYQYMGRKQLSNDQVLDSFQYKVSVNGKPVLATVQITHHLKNNRLVSLSVTEQPQQ